MSVGPLLIPNGLDVDSELVINNYETLKIPGNKKGAHGSLLNNSLL